MMMTKSIFSVLYLGIYYNAWDLPKMESGQMQNPPSELTWSILICTGTIRYNAESNMKGIYLFNLVI